MKYPDGRADYLQFKDDQRNGYGIETYANGIYRGEFKNELPDGYGLIKYYNGDEYDGQWWDDWRHG